MTLAIEFQSLKIVVRWNDRHLARVYATNHKTMGKGVKCDNGDEDFGRQGGITNGAAWYSVAGGMQDFNYLASNTFEITLELGCNKYPPAERLEEEWENNRNALIEFIKQVHIGVKGLVLDIFGQPIENAIIRVDNITSGFDQMIDHDIRTSESAFYSDSQRLLNEFSISSNFY